MGIYNYEDFIEAGLDMIFVQDSQSKCKRRSWLPNRKSNQCIRFRISYFKIGIRDEGLERVLKVFIEKYK